MSSLAHHAARIVGEPTRPLSTPAPPSLHALLRESTRASHVRLDAAMSSFDLQDASSYRRFLGIHRTALMALSSGWSTADRAEFAPLLDQLDADLGMCAPAAGARYVQCARDDAPSQAGFAYVVRGSRLGAAFLLKRVGPQLPTAYLRHRVTTPWPAFLATLNADPRWKDHTARSQVIEAAHFAFAVFGGVADAGGTGRAMPNEG